MTILFIITGVLLFVSFMINKQKTLNGLREGDIQL